MDICFRPQEHIQEPGGSRHFLKLPAVELDGVRHETIINGSIELATDMIPAITASFMVSGRPEIYAVGEDLEPLDGWDPRTVHIPDGIDLDWRTIVEVAEDPILWHEMVSMVSGPSPEPGDASLKIGMRPFPSLDSSVGSHVRALQRLVWIELDGQRFSDFTGLRIDGDPVENLFTVEISFIGTAGIVPEQRP